SVVVRGYPEKAEHIRKRLKLKENAEHYLLATVWGNERGFIAARRLGA
ncbi:MAG: SAM-dependent methyltransferase, partial [Flavobacteriia bacterium]|nr:SAM-dependent methyltransferase [Flavobacteriia bacterium]